MTTLYGSTTTANEAHSIDAHIFNESHDSHVWAYYAHIIEQTPRASSDLYTKHYIII